MLQYIVFAVFGFCFIHNVSCTYIHAMKEEQYEVIVDLIRNNDKFNIPKHLRTNVHKKECIIKSKDLGTKMIGRVWYVGTTT